MTMDILWAISHPATSSSAAGFGDPYNMTSSFSMPNPAATSNSWDMYDDFVGGVQFWGYGLVSGSGDGAVRMWDSKLNCSSSSVLKLTTLQCALDRRTVLCWAILAL